MILLKLFVGNETLDLLYVGLVGHNALAQVSLSLGGLLVQNVGFVSVAADRLTVFGKLETFLRAGIGLDFGHNDFPPSIFASREKRALFCDFCSDEHENVAVFKLGGFFYRAVFAYGFGKLLHDLNASFGVSHFTAAKPDRNLYAVARL